MREYTIAFYMRLSSEDANEGESDSITNQRDLLYNYIRQIDEFQDASVEEFTDDGYSGKSFNRPAMDRLLHKVAQGQVSCIVVKDFSRFGRNHLEAGKYLETIFPFYNVRFISVNDYFDSAKEPFGTSGMEVALKNLIHETYIRDISEKIRSVQRYKMKKGEYICPIAPFGYVKSLTAKNKLEVDLEAAKTVRYIFQLACKGYKATSIAKTLNQENVLTPLMHRKKNNNDSMRGWTATQDTNIWTDKAVRRILQDRRFTGDMVGHRSEKIDVLSCKIVRIQEENRIIVPGMHEAIVSKEMFDTAQTVIQGFRIRNHNVLSSPLFARLLRCGDCKHFLSYERTKQPYYHCIFASFTPDGQCSYPIDEARLTEKIREILHENFSLCSNEQSILPKTDIKNIEKEIMQINAQIAKQENLLSNMIADYSKDIMSKEDFLNKRREIHEQIDSLNQKKTALAETQEGNEENKHIEVFLSPDDELMRADLERLIKVIFVYRDNTMEIEWTDVAGEKLPCRFSICE